MENFLAYDYFLRGRSYMRRENLEFATQMSSYRHIQRLRQSFPF